MDASTKVQTILFAASSHNTDALRALLRSGPFSARDNANVQDLETRRTPLHAAIAAWSSTNDGQEQRTATALTNGDGHAPYVDGNPITRPTNSQEGREEAQRAAQKTVHLLLQHGAIWNDLDANDETPGCLAWRLGNRELYDMIVDAGVRAEILLNRLDEYQTLGDEDDDDNSDEQKDKEGEANWNGGRGEAEDTPSITITGPTVGGVDTGVHAEDVNSSSYLSSDVTYNGDRLLDADSNGVMMSWETEIMRRSAALLAPTPGLRILNVGFGMGIIDTIFQDTIPSAHHIIEAHPAVLAKMKSDGWYERPGVTVHEGRWQDIVAKLAEENSVFDAIYFDTFAEDYAALRTFFTEHVIALLDSSGQFGFFNGLGADRQVCYDVYSKVVEMDLFEAGFDTKWETLKVPDLGEEWKGVRRKYWVLENYRLPTCTFIG